MREGRKFFGIVSLLLIIALFFSQTVYASGTSENLPLNKSTGDMTLAEFLDTFNGMNSQQIIALLGKPDTDKKISEFNEEEVTYKNRKLASYDGYLEFNFQDNVLGHPSVEAYWYYGNTDTSMSVFNNLKKIADTISVQKSKTGDTYYDCYTQSRNGREFVVRCDRPEYTTCVSYVYEPSAASAEQKIKLVDAAGKEETSGTAKYDVLQHLAFANLAYSDMEDNDKGTSVSDFIKKRISENEGRETEFNDICYTDPIWKSPSPQMTSQQFYDSFVGDWKIVKHENHNSTTGFVATVFQKDNSIVIAYCGSQGDIFDKNNNLTADWATDAEFGVLNALSAQFDEADVFYQQVAAAYPGADITFTGHSLGGALAAAESILHGIRSYGFDSAEGHIIGLMYMYKALQIDAFRGIDACKDTNYTDRIGFAGADVIQHEYTELYNLDEFKTGGDEINDNVGNNLAAKKNIIGFYSHKIFSCLSPVSSSEIKFNDSVWKGSAQTPYVALINSLNEEKISNLLQTAYDSGLYKALQNLFEDTKIQGVKAFNFIKPITRILLGTTKNDVLTAPSYWLLDNIFKANTNLFAGSGTDSLMGYSGSDILTAGSGGNKNLDGMSGDDLYVINKDSGSTASVTDCGGRNVILIKGFSNLTRSSISAVTSSKIKIQGDGISQFITLQVLGKDTTVDVVLEHGNSYYTYTWEELAGVPQGGASSSSGEKLIEADGTGIMEILDAAGKVVKTISNAAATQKNDYEDYGFFYAVNDQNGKKLIAYTLNGYSVRLSGSSSVNIASAPISSDGVKNFRIVKNVNLADGSIIQKNANNTVTLTKEDGSRLSGGQTVIPINSLSCEDLSLKTGETKKLNPAVNGDATSSPVYTYESGNPNIVTVDTAGNVKASAAGSTSVKIIASDGYNVISRSINVTVGRASGNMSIRLGGSGRYDTASDIVKNAFPNGCRTVVLASGANWPDALAASALAGVKNCPVVLSEPGRLSWQTASLINSLGVSDVIIVGGTNSVSENVRKELILLGINENSIRRIYGNNRMQTAQKIEEEVMKTSTSDTCIIASGSNYPDALSISAYAYANKIPIFLTGHGRKLTPATLNAASYFKKAIIIGSYSSVSADVEEQLKKLSVVRYGGSNRYETSIDIMKNLYGDTIPAIAVATGRNFPDALAGAALAGQKKGAIMLVNGTSQILTDKHKTILEGSGTVWILGSEKSVSAEIKNEIDKCMLLSIK